MTRFLAPDEVFEFKHPIVRYSYGGDELGS